MPAVIRLALAALAALLALFIALGAQAQTSCGSRDLVVSRLQEQWGETLQARGLISADLILEVFASSESGTWTALRTSAGGMSCVIASGQNFIQVGTTLGPPGIDG